MEHSPLVATCRTEIDWNSTLCTNSPRKATRRMLSRTTLQRGIKPNTKFGEARRAFLRKKPCVSTAKKQTDKFVSMVSLREQLRSLPPTHRRYRLPNNQHNPKPPIKSANPAASRLSPCYAPPRPNPETRICVVCPPHHSHKPGGDVKNHSRRLPEPFGPCQNTPYSAPPRSSNTFPSWYNTPTNLKHPPFSAFSPPVSRSRFCGLSTIRY